MTARTITTLEERWALPRGTVIRDAAGVAWVKRPISWMATTPIEDDQWIGMPATVLHDPSAPAPAPSVAPEAAPSATRDEVAQWLLCPDVWRVRDDGRFPPGHPAAEAVVRDHLPVKPDREAVRRAQHRALVPQVMSIFAAVGGAQADYDALLDTLADAALDLWPGRSEAEVKAEALREAADAVTEIDGRADDDAARWLRVRADRLAAEGGDDRG